VKSQAILESLRRENVNNQIVLARLLFVAQAVKSASTVTLAIAGVFLEAPAAVAGAGIALGYDVLMEFIKHTGPQNEPHADAVVVGFQQTAANDVVGVAGSVRSQHLERTQKALEKTLRYRNKSSTYRSAVAEGARLDKLLKTLGVISAGVTIYQEGEESWAAYQQMKRTESSAH
jgi:hypothetical protein